MHATAPSSRPSLPPTGGIFYGWWIVVLCFSFQLFASGVLFSVFPVLLKPLAEALGATRAEISFATSLQFVLGVVFGVWIGDQVSKRSARWMIVAAMSAGVLGLIALAGVDSLIGLYLIYGALFAFAGEGTAIAANALLANWFIRRRGLALGIAGSGAAIAAAMVGPIVVLLLEELGWQLALLSLAIPTVVLVPLAWWLIVDRPEERETYPDGDRPLHGAPAAFAGEEWTLRRALREPQLWLLVITIGFMLPGFLGAVMVLYPHLTDLGFSETAASAVLPAVAIPMAIGGPLFGILGDRVSNRALFLIGIALQALGVVGILLARELAEFLISAAIFGLGAGTMLILEKLAIGAIFGRRAFGRVLGLLGFLIAPVVALAPPLVNLVFDWTGSYRPAFYAVLPCYGVSVVALAFLRIPRTQQPGRARRAR